jgi:CysZ protein
MNETRSSLVLFMEGVFLLSAGMGFLRRERRLWPLAVVPVLFALAAVATAGTMFWTHIGWVHQSWSSLLPALEATDWWTWIWIGPGRAIIWLLGWLAVLLSFAVSLVAALLVANLASAPFLDRLSERVEAIALGRTVTPGDEESLLSGIVRSFAGELQRISFLIGLWGVLTLLGFIVPGAHLITGPLLVAMTILFLPLDYAGFALDRRRVSFGSRRRWLRAHLSTMAGFGGVAFLACLVPGLNLVILPSLVTAGTLLVARTQPETTPPVVAA